MAKKHDVHVSPKGGDRKGWKVTQASEVQSTHRTQQAAIDAGRREAKRDGVDLVTHNQKGVIRQQRLLRP